MKKRLVPVITLTVALVLVAGLAYAAKKKDPLKSADRSQDPTHEEEALQAELLEAAGERVAMASGSGKPGSKRTIPAVSGENSNDQILSGELKK